MLNKCSDFVALLLTFCYYAVLQFAKMLNRLEIFF